MKFEIEYIGYIIIDAKDKHDADRIFALINPYNTRTPVSYTEIDTSRGTNTTGQTHEVIGFCEISGKSIFEGDDFVSDDDGVMWLKSEEDNLIGNPRDLPI